MTNVRVPHAGDDGQVAGQAFVGGEHVDRSGVVGIEGRRRAAGQPRWEWRRHRMARRRVLAHGRLCRQPADLLHAIHCGPQSEEEQVAKRNLTIQLEEDVITQAKVLAARRGTSVSTLVASELERLVAHDDRYEDAYRRAQRALSGAKPRGGRRWSRDDLYDR